MWGLKAMPVVNLTKRGLSALPEEVARRTVFYDTVVKGLGYRVSPRSKRDPNGARVWILEYRGIGADRRTPKKRITLAPGSLDPARARELARDLLADIRKGADPAGERRRLRRADSVAQLFDAYMAEHVGPKLKPRTAQLYRAYVANHVKHAWGGRKAEAIRREDVQRLHRHLGAAKPDGLGKPGAANRILIFIQGAYTWAAANGAVSANHPNPAKGVRRFPERPCERFLSGDELARLGEALALAEGDGIPWTPEPGPKSKHAPRAESRRVKYDPWAIAAIRLLCVTGLRLREVLHLTWDAVDLERGIITLEDSKVGRRPVVLGAAAVEILRDLEPVGKFVIAGDRAGSKEERPRADLQKPWARVRDYAGLDGVRLHDLRHTYASTGAAGGVGLQAVGALLGHRDTETTKRHSHLTDYPLRRAADMISTAIEQQLSRKLIVPSVTPRPQT